MSERIVKVGIIGCGGIANGKHMPSLKNLSDVQMVAFCDIIPERAEKAAGFIKKVYRYNAPELPLAYAHFVPHTGTHST